MPAELASQIPALKEMLSIMNIKMLEKEGIEADDLIGTVAKRFNIESIIFTGDRDSFQLVNDLTSVCFMKRGISDYVLITPQNIVKEYGVKAEQVVDLKALQGDSSDNIPGVSGIGPKTAIELIEKFGSLENVYKYIDQIGGKVHDKLVEDKEKAYLSQKLATIETNINIDCSLDDCKLNYPFNRRLIEFFERFNMRSLINKDEIFEASCEELKNKQSNSEKVIEIIKSSEKLKNITDLHTKFDNIALFITKNGDLHLAFDEVTEFVCLAPVDLISGGIENAEALLILKPILENDSVKKIYYDAKTFFHLLDKNSIALGKNYFDVSIAVNITEGIVIKSPDDIFEFYGNGKDVPAIDLICDYKVLSGKIRDLKLETLVYDEEFKLIQVLFNMEKRGFKIDVLRLTELEQEYKNKIDRLTKQIYSLAGSEFNINSPKQLATVLFEKLHLPNISKGGTSVDVLEKLLGMHEIIPLLLDYRKATKFHGTYLAGMREHIDQDGKVRTNFNQSLTATGRLSSSEPNLQNIPIRSEEGRGIRSLFTASNPNRVLIDADYSQIELRVLAHLSKDDFYINAFKNSQDIHAKTAGEVFQVSPDKVSDVQRRIAKVVNFGVVYGISQFGLSSDLKISAKEAKQYIDNFYQIHPNIQKYMENEINFAKNCGFVKTAGGRIRKIPEINASNFMVRQRAERIAQNTSIQGTAAEIIKRAMINVEQRLNQLSCGAELIMQVHDELVVDCPTESVEKVKTIIRDEMIKAADMIVPMEVSIDCAFRWGEAH